MKVTMNRRRGVAHYIAHTSSFCVAANAFTCVAIKPYPAKECDKEYFKLMARWNDANRPG
jgi:hypothetical protein